MKSFTKCFLIAATLSTTACMPDHLKELDGKNTRAVLSKSSGRAIVLRNEQGVEFFADSPKLDVKIEVNRLSASRLYVSDGGQTAVFEIPKSVLNQEGSIVSVPAHVSKQPVDLRVKESSMILRDWTHYSHSQTPIFMTTCTNGTCSQTLIGFTDDYYKVHEGIVQYNLFIDVYEVGASVRGFPDAEKQGSLKMAVFARQEVLSSRSVSYAEYRKNGGR